MSAYNLLAVIGATASGKTHLAVQLAQLLHGEIISADSRQVYRGLDIGSGKDIEEYQEVPYHLIDIVDPGYEYSVFDFQQDFLRAFEQINAQQHLPVLAGGTALYVDAVLKGYRMLKVDKNPILRAELASLNHQTLVERLIRLKPNLHNTTDIIERERVIRAIEIAEAEQSTHQDLPPFPAINPLILAIDWPRTVLRERITSRLKQRFASGMIEEVEQLHQQGVAWQTLEFYGLEYRFIAQYLQGQLNKNDMFQKLNAAIHQFAKKQDTWLRRLSRQGFDVHLLPGDNSFATARQIIAKFQS